jgi:hypothetical protein
VGKEGGFETDVGKYTLHGETKGNESKMIDFVTARNMAVSTTLFQHKSIDLQSQTSLSG